MSFKGFKHTEETKRKMRLAKEGKKRPETSGKNHWKWKNGRRKHSKGYIWILSPNHPFCDKQGYVLEHRLVVEKCIGRYLTLEEIVHHINNNPSDNRPKNLMLFPKEITHRKYHRNKISGGYKWSYLNK